MKKELPGKIISGKIKQPISSECIKIDLYDDDLTQFALAINTIRSKKTDFENLHSLLERICDELIMEEVPYSFEKSNGEKVLTISVSSDEIIESILEVEENGGYMSFPMVEPFIDLLREQFTEQVGSDPDDMEYEYIQGIPPMLQAACPSCYELLPDWTWDKSKETMTCVSCDERKISVEDWEWFHPDDTNNYSGEKPSEPPKPCDAACPNCGYNVIRVSEKGITKHFCQECFGLWDITECHHLNQVNVVRAETKNKRISGVVAERKHGIMEIENEKYHVPQTDHKCDSLMEALFDRLLYKKNVEFDREPQHFKIDGGYYIPDFKVGEIIVEVKGFKHPAMEEGAIRKAKQFIKHHPEYEYVVIGTPKTECIPCDKWVKWGDRWKLVNWLQKQISN